MEREMTDEDIIACAKALDEADVPMEEREMWLDGRHYSNKSKDTKKEEG